MDSSFSRKMWRWIAAGDSWGEIRDVQDAVKEHLPEDCNPAIVESLQFQYEELDIDEYLERLQEETEGLDCEPG